MNDLFLRSLFTWRSAIASKYGPESSITRHVLLTLSLHMNERGESCFPSMNLLAEETSLSRRAVVQHLQLAFSEGWVGKRDMRKQNTQGWRRVEYFALIPPVVEQKFHAEQDGALDAPPSGSERRGAPNAPSRRGASGAKGGAPDSANVVHPVHPSTSRSTTGGDSAAARRTRLPKDFKISDRVWEWAKGKGFPLDLMPAHLEKFLRTVKANGSKYVDWDEALMNCIADDWGEVRRKAFGLGGLSLASTKPRICGYCPKPSIGNVNGIEYCNAHSLDAMDRKPRPEADGARA